MAMTVIIRDRLHMYPTKFEGSEQREEAGHKAVEIAVSQKDYTSSWKSTLQQAQWWGKIMSFEIWERSVYILN